MLCLVVALAAEAHPLLASHPLQGMSGHPYRICASEQTHLIVSGVGKVAAAATSYPRTGSRWDRHPLPSMALQRRDEVLRYLQQHLADMEFTLTR